MRHLTILLFAAASLAWPQTGHEGHHGHGGDKAMDRALEAPSRAEWQQPDKVVKALKLRRDEVVADIGAGTGYFTRRFAPLVKRVYAVDINKKRLKRLEKAGLANVEIVHAKADDPKLPPESVDTVFFCNVLHHIEDRPSYYARLARALKPGGRVVNIDFYKRELPVGPPVSMKLTREEVIEEFERAGFRLAEEFDFLPYQYFLVFEKK